MSEPSSRSEEQPLAGVIRERDAWRARAEAAEQELARERLQVGASGAKRYGLVWEHRPDEALEHQLRTCLPVIAPVSMSLDIEGAVPNHTTPHLLIEGENLHALIAMQATHRGRVDVIYIDPPYNTGNSDFTYNDSYVSPEDTYRHSKWITMMAMRLSLAKPLLSPSGFLAISIDDNEMAALKLLLDQTFGEAQVKVIAVKMSEAAGVKMAAAKRYGSLPKLKEYVLIAKASNLASFNVGVVPKGKWDTNYRYALAGFTPEMRQRIAELEAGEAITEDERTEVEAMLSGVTYVAVRSLAASEGVDIKDKAVFEAWLHANSWRVAGDTNGGGSIRGLVAERKAREGTLPEQDVIAVRTVTGKLYLARPRNGNTILLADNNLMTHPGDFWTDIRTTSLGSEGGVTFKNGKKPLKLLKRLIAAHPNKNAVVLDFFAGSGSTAQAVAELNAADAGERQCILVTNNENGICRDITQPRLAGCFGHAWANGRGHEPLPGSAKFYELRLVARSENRDATRARLASELVGVVALRENAHQRVVQDGPLTRLESPDKVVLIWTDLFSALQAEDAIRAYRDSGAAGGREVVVYLGSWDGDGGSELARLSAFFSDWSLEAIPDSILEELEKTQRLLLRRTG